MTINIRDIQHYMYCPRRFALLAINKDWSENIFVVKANIMHENVHSGKHEYKGSKKIELSSIAVYNDELDLYGVTDCIEFEKKDDGTYIDALHGNYSVKLIEYKPTQPQNGTIRETDAIQVFAQKLCADYIWKCSSEGFIYYADTRKRVRLPFDTDYRNYLRKLNELLENMKQCIEAGKIPDRIKGQKCSGCSIKDLCIPKSKKYSIRKEIMEDI